MISPADIIESLILECDWIIHDVLHASDEVVMFSVKRKRINNQINQYYYAKHVELNFIVKPGLTVSVWDLNLTTNACLGDFSLIDPSSLYDLEKILS